MTAKQLPYIDTSALSGLQCPTLYIQRPLLSSSIYLQINVAHINVAHPTLDAALYLEK